MQRHHRRRKAITAAVGVIAAAGVLSGCAAPSEAEEPTASEFISADRCAANQRAGEITFLTVFGYLATAGILDVLAAQDQGYFEDLCLDVTIEPGSTNAQLVSAGTAQIGGLGGASDVMVARAAGADVVGIATYANVGAMELMTMAESGIESLDDFVGKTVGYKVAIPPQFQAMFAKNDIDPATINWVSVGWDPTILPQGQVDALAGFIPNEPQDLGRQGYDIVEWNPNDFGIESTFNTQIANREWAEEHPTAVEDFLRATMKGLEWINSSDENLDTALEVAAGLSEAGYDIELSKLRWQKEMELMAASQPEGTGIGWQSAEQWQAEAEMLLEYDLVAEAPDVESAIATEYIDAIYDDGALIWPAP